MKFLVLFALFYLVASQTECPNAPANPQDRRPDKEHLSVAAYNAEWLFLTRSNCPGTGCPWTTVAAAEAHMQKVADELVVLNADIVSFAEVQDCYVLGRLSALVPSLGYLPYLVKGTDTATGQNVGILTRVDPVVDMKRTEARVAHPIPGSQCGSTSSGTYGVSKHYYTTFNVDGLPRPLSMMGMHFLAYPDDKTRCVQREAQASVIKNLTAAALEAGHSAIVMGDLNDFDGLVKDQANSTPISQVLNLLRDPLPADGDELMSAASFAPQSTRYSYWYDSNDNCQISPNELTAIDHMLFSNDLAPYVESVTFAHTYAAVCGTNESDHWPILLTLRTNDHSHVTDAPSTPTPDSSTTSADPPADSSTDGAEQITNPGKQSTGAGTIVGVLFAGIVIGCAAVGTAWFIVHRRTHTHRFLSAEDDTNNSIGLGP